MLRKKTFLLYVIAISRISKAFYNFILLPLLSHRKQSLNLNVELTNMRKQFKERNGDEKREKERDSIRGCDQERKKGYIERGI